LLNTVTPLDKAIDHFRRGGFVALLDSASREDEADLLQAAQSVTGESINFMLTHVRGLITVAMASQRLSELQIPVLDQQFCAENMPRFAMPVDYTPAVTTGVSAFDRAATIQALADRDTRPEDFARPGHVFPLAAAPGGLADRAGHTEGAVGLSQLAELPPVVAMCEIMAPDGHMSAGSTLQRFLEAHNVPLVTVEQIAQALGLRPAGPQG